MTKIIANIINKIGFFLSSNFSKSVKNIIKENKKLKEDIALVKHNEQILLAATMHEDVAVHYNRELLRLKGLKYSFDKIHMYDYAIRKGTEKSLMWKFYDQKDKKWQFTTNFPMFYDGDYLKTIGIDSIEQFVEEHFKHIFPIHEYEIRNGFLNFSYSPQRIRDIRNAQWLY